MTYPERGFLKRSKRHLGLNLTQNAVWREIARQISETGRSPSHVQVGDAIGVTYQVVCNAVGVLKAGGYLRVTGHRHSTLIHVVKWPDGTEPRETEGRADQTSPGRLRRAPVKHERPKVAAPSPKPKAKAQQRQPNLDRGPRTCATPSCRLPKQPGRAHCASCLRTRMPERTRADMSESLFVGGVARS